MLIIRLNSLYQKRGSVGRETKAGEKPVLAADQI
jgi:hypothetical protein